MLSNDMEKDTDLERDSTERCLLPSLPLAPAAPPAPFSGAIGGLAAPLVALLWSMKGEELVGLLPAKGEASPLRD